MFEVHNHISNKVLNLTRKKTEMKKKHAPNNFLSIHISCGLLSPEQRQMLTGFNTDALKNVDSHIELALNLHLANDRVTKAKTLRLGRRYKPAKGFVWLVMLI